jgi:hypothetical protein
VSVILSAGWHHTIAIAECSGFRGDLHALLTVIESKPEEISMPESPSANIIQFPAKSTAPATAKTPSSTQHVPTEAETRLSRALIALNEALITQRAAVAAWKASLGELSAVTGRLGASLRTYNDTIEHLDIRVASLRSEAVKLESWADTAIAGQG